MHMQELAGSLLCNPRKVQGRPGRAGAGTRNMTSFEMIIFIALGILALCGIVVTVLALTGRR
jgi:hypothetical protein